MIITSEITTMIAAVASVAPTSTSEVATRTLVTTISSFKGQIFISKIMTTPSANVSTIG